MKLKKSLKKIVAVVCSMAMIVSGIWYSPVSTVADEGDLTINDFELEATENAGQLVYMIKNLSFTAYKGSAAADYAYAAYIDEISTANLVRNKGANWLWGISNGGNNLHYNEVWTNNDSSIYFEPGSTHKFIVAVYDKVEADEKDDVTKYTPIETFEKEFTFPAEIEKTPEMLIKEAIQSDDNIAKGKSYFSTSGNATEAFDQNFNSRWVATSKEDGEYVGVDLRGVYQLSSVSIMWEGAYSKEYYVQVSSDSKNYETVKTVTANKAETLSIDLTDVNAEGQFVRIYCTKEAGYNFSIWDIGVYGEKTGEGIKMPEKPFGLNVRAGADNQILAVWGASSIPEQKYNVYVDDELKLANVGASEYAIDGIPAGDHIVKITGVIGEVESEPVIVNVTVTGASQGNDPANPGDDVEEILANPYSALTWEQVGDSEYYVSSLEKLNFTQKWVDHGVFLEFNYGPAYTNVTINGNALPDNDGNHNVAGAWLRVLKEELEDDIYNVLEGTGANGKFHIIIKKGEANPKATFENGEDKVDADVVSAKAQMAEGKIRFVSSVDSLKYQEVGFKVSGTYGGQKLSQKILKTSTVYSNIFNGDVLQTPAEAMGVATSEYCFTYAVTGLATDTDSEWTVTPYVVRNDGVRVLGETKTFAITDGVLAEK